MEKYESARSLNPGGALGKKLRERIFFTRLWGLYVKYVNYSSSFHAPNHAFRVVKTNIIAIFDDRFGEAAFFDVLTIIAM